MHYTIRYHAPIGTITIASNETALTGLWLDGQKYYADTLDAEYLEKPVPVLEETRRWLDIYFSGREPDFMPPTQLQGSAFRMQVWEILKEIPYGQTLSYGQITKMIEERTGKRASAQAVGGAVGHNPISIIIPCHRVVGADGSLTGYAGGVDKKIRLLVLEGIDATEFA